MTFEKFNKIMKRDYPYLISDDCLKVIPYTYLEQLCIREIANIPVMRSLHVFYIDDKNTASEVEFKSMVRAFALCYIREHEEEIMFREL
jgi:hypothetical protein